MNGTYPLERRPEVETYPRLLSSVLNFGVLIDLFKASAGTYLCERLSLLHTLPNAIVDLVQIKVHHIRGEYAIE